MMMDINGLNIDASRETGWMKGKLNQSIRLQAVMQPVGSVINRVWTVHRIWCNDSEALALVLALRPIRCPMYSVR